MKKVVFLLFTVLIFQPAYPQVNSGQTLTDTLKPDYRNHTNIPEYNPALMPLDRQTAGTGIWTELNPKVPRVDYLGIHFINKDTGWAVGAQGVILKSTDGGEGWQNILSPVTTVLTNVHSFNGQVVLAVGYDGIIIRSDDSGINWQQATSGVTGDLWRVQMINDTLGWACGLGPSLLKTTDAGLAWNPVNTGFASFQYWSLDFYNEDIGYIAGGYGNILKTTNAGNTWQHLDISLINEYSFYSIDVVTPSRIFAGSFGRIVYTTNAGNTWQIVGTSNTVYTIAFVDSLLGYAGDNGGITWKTIDGGISWQLHNWYPLYTKNWIMFVDDSTGYIAGNGLNIQKTTDAGAIWLSTIMNDNFNDVHFVTETTGFITSNKLYKTENGGLNWNIVPKAPGGSNILFLDNLTGFIGGSQTLFKTIDGGGNWYVVNGVPGGVGKIIFINSLMGWATSGRNIIKTTDGGENWVVQFTHPSLSFTSISFVDSISGWATILSSRPFKTTDSGISWIQQTNLEIWSSRDIYFLNTSKGFIIDGLFDLLKTTNSGNIWFNQLNSQYVIRSFGWLSPLHGLIIGDGIYESNDSGNTWQEIIELRNIGLRKLHSPKNYLGYSIGNLGLIYKYIDTTIVPVELVSFAGSIIDGKVQLEWNTATELNNLGFEIQKSNDKENWINIGFVEGRGTSSEKNYYNFQDNNIVSTKNYYRLKQIDFDGIFCYSEITEVSFPIDNYYLSQNYPNPFNPASLIQFGISDPSKVKIVLFDVAGQEVKTLIDK